MRNLVQISLKARSIKVGQSLTMYSSVSMKVSHSVRSPYRSRHELSAAYWLERSPGLLWAGRFLKEKIYCGERKKHEWIYDTYFCCVVIICDSSKNRNSDNQEKRNVITYIITDFAWPGIESNSICIEWFYCVVNIGSITSSSCICIIVNIYFVFLYQETQK